PLRPRRRGGRRDRGRAHPHGPADPRRADAAVRVAAAAQDGRRRAGPDLGAGGARPRGAAAARVRRAGRTGHRPGAGRRADRRALATVPTRPDTAPAALRAILVLAQAGAVEDAEAGCAALFAVAARWQHRPLLARVHGLRSYLAHRAGRLRAALDEARRGCRLL